jgi:hypothetical protein
MDDSPAINRARMRAEECRRRTLELSSGDPITHEDIEFAIRRAEDARASAEAAKASATKVLAWLAEQRKQLDRAVLRAEEARTSAEQAQVVAAAMLDKLGYQRILHNAAPTPEPERLIDLRLVRRRGGPVALP